VCAETPVALKTAASEERSAGSWNWLADRFTATDIWMPIDCQRLARSQTWRTVQ
jgi:hypothetical protein